MYSSRDRKEDTEKKRITLIEVTVQGGLKSGKRDKNKWC